MTSGWWTRGWLDCCTLIYDIRSAPPHRGRCRPPLSHYMRARIANESFRGNLIMPIGARAATTSPIKNQQFVHGEVVTGQRRKHLITSDEYSCNISQSERGGRERNYNCDAGYEYEGSVSFITSPWLTTQLLKSLVNGCPVLLVLLVLIGTVLLTST